MTECFTRERVPQPSGSLPKGRWTRIPSHAWPYRMNRTLWNEIGVNHIRDVVEHAHAYGRCDVNKDRTLYDWQPASCSLEPLTADGACGPRRLLGRQALFIGDSTTAQLFLSYVLSIGGRFGRNLYNTGTFVSLTATACNGTLRLSYERADALLWASGTMNGGVTGLGCPCLNGMMTHKPFVGRAKTADSVVLGVGQHFARLIESTPPHYRHVSYAFFVQNLNKTLSAIAAANPESTRIVVGASTPVPGCSKPGAFTAPTSAMTALSDEAGGAATNVNAVSWWHHARLNAMARAVALETGATFIDLTELSSSRADDAMGRFPVAGRFEDCVHYCMPGVVDTFSRLVHNALAARTPAARLSSDEWSKVGRHTVEETAWLGQRGAGLHLEGLLADHHQNKIIYESDAWWAKVIMGTSNCSSLCPVVLQHKR